MGACLSLRSVDEFVEPERRRRTLTLFARSKPTLPHTNSAHRKAPASTFKAQHLNRVASVRSRWEAPTVVAGNEFTSRASQHAIRICGI